MKCSDITETDNKGSLSRIILTTKIVRIAIIDHLNVYYVPITHIKISHV